MAAKSDLAIASGQPTELVFVVDKVEYTKTQFEEKFEGYKVEFLSDKKGQVTFDKDGKVTATENFKYAVQVTTPEGEKIPTNVVNTHFEEVKVVDATKATKVIEIGLVQGENAWKNATVTTADKVEIKPTVFANGLGTTTADQDENGALTEEATKLAKNAPEIAKVTSSNPTVAFYEKGNGIQVRKDGKVTFTVEFEEKDIEALQTTVEVKVVAEQTATSIQAKDLKVKADAETEVKFDVLDQNGEKLRTDATVFIAVTPEGKKEAEATEVSATTGEATTEIKFAKGNNVVTVYGADKEGTAIDKDVVLGTFKVEAVDVSDEAKIEKYKLVNNNKDEEGNVKPLDLNVDEDVNNTTLELDVEAYIKDIKVNLKNDVTLVAKSSDAKVVALDGAENGYVAVDKDEAKVTATAKAAGKSVITLYTKEGDLLTPVDTFEVTVNDTTKAITELPFKEGVKHVTIKDSDKAEEQLKNAVVAAVDEKVKLTVAKIAKVETLKADEKVIVTMAKEYGGKEIVLPALFTSLESVETVITDKVKTEAAKAIEEQTIDLSDLNVATEASVISQETYDKLDADITFTTVGALKTALEQKYTVTSDDQDATLNVATKASVISQKTYTELEADITFTTVAELKEALGKKYDVAATDSELKVFEKDADQDTEEAVGTITIADLKASEPVGTIDTSELTAEKEASEVTVQGLGEITYEGQEKLVKKLEEAGYEVKVEETNLTYSKPAVEEVKEFTQTVTFTFSGNVTLAEDASFELKDADGKVIATEAKATVGTDTDEAKKTVTIKIVTEDKASPTVATATLEGATVNKILQIIKNEKVEDTTPSEKSK